METLIFFALLFGYAIIGSFVAGILRRINVVEDDIVILALTGTFWPGTLLIALILAAFWAGKTLVSWIKGKPQ